MSLLTTPFPTHCKGYPSSKVEAVVSLVIFFRLPTVTMAAELCVYICYGSSLGTRYGLTDRTSAIHTAHNIVITERKGSCSLHKDVCGLLARWGTTGHGGPLSVWAKCTCFVALQTCSKSAVLGQRVASRLGVHTTVP